MPINIEILARQIEPEKQHWCLVQVRQFHPAHPEQEAHSVARKGRRAEAKAQLAFPETGSVKYTDPWEKLARDNCNWDHGKLADAFRSFCSQKGIKLGARNIETVFVNFCQSQKRI